MYKIMPFSTQLARSTPERALRVRAMAGGHCVVFLGKTLYSHGADFTDFTFTYTVKLAEKKTQQKQH